MKKIFILSLACVLVFSCNKDDSFTPDIPGQNQEILPPAPPVANPKLISCKLVEVRDGVNVVEDAKSSMNDLAGLLGIKTKSLSGFEEIELSLDTLSTLIMSTYQISYLSKDIAGKDIILSTLVSVPSHKDGKKLVLNNISLSHSMFNMTDTMTKLIAKVTEIRSILYSEAIVSPFYQGGGVDKRLPGTYVPIAEHRLKAKQAIDGELAALELLDSLEKDNSINVELSEDYFTYNMGISNGGACALAVLEILENDPDYIDINNEKIRLQGSFVGESCADYAMLYENHIDEYDEGMSMNFLKPDALVATINSCYKTHAVFAPKDYFFYTENEQTLKIQLEDYFTPEFNDVKIELEEGVFSFTDLYDACFWLADVSLPKGITSTITLHGFEKLDQILNTNLFNEDGTINRERREWKALMCAMKENSLLEGYSPKTPVYIINSMGDHFLPYEVNAQLYKNISDNGQNPNVKMRTLLLLDHFPATFYVWGMELFHKNPCVPAALKFWD